MKPTVLRRRSQGFTLIEILVVMVLVALVSGVLFQALSQAYRLKERFGTELFNVQQGQMAADWYRQSVNGLYPDYPDGDNVFKGSAQEFSGLSTNPLSEDYGVVTPVRWKIQGQRANGVSSLVYVTDKQETPLFSWRSDEARFVYLDDQHEPHDQWPPAVGKFPQLPSQIQVHSKEGREPLRLVASPMGPANPLLRLKDALGIEP